MDGIKALSFHLSRLSVKGTTLNDAKIFMQTYSVLLMTGTTEFLGYVCAFLICVAIIVLYHISTFVIVSCYFCKAIVEIVFASKNILTKSVSVENMTKFYGAFISDYLNTKTKLLVLISSTVFFVSLKLVSSKEVFTNPFDGYSPEVATGGVM